VQTLSLINEDLLPVLLPNRTSARKPRVRGTRAVVVQSPGASSLRAVCCLWITFLEKGVYFYWGGNLIGPSTPGEFHNPGGKVNNFVSCAPFPVDLIYLSRIRG